MNTHSCKTGRTLCIAGSALLYIVLFSFMLYVKTCGFSLSSFLIPSDDNLYSHALDSKSLLQYLHDRWFGWSSRLLIDGTLAILCRNYIVSVTIDSLAFCVTMFLFGRLLFGKTTFRSTLICFGLMMTFPLSSISVCADSINYLWPMMFLCIALLPLADAIREPDTKIKPWLYIIATTAALFAVDHELVAGSAFCIGAVACICAKKHGNAQIHRYALLLLCISAIAITKTLLCPGNHIRTVIDTARWYPEFPQIGLLAKVYLGITSCVTTLLHSATVFFLFCTVGFMTLLRQRRHVVANYICALFASLLMLWRFICIVTKHNSNLFYYANNEAHILNIGIDSVLLLLCCMAVIAMLYFYVATAVPKRRVLLLTIFTIGLGSRVMMGFSPTVFGSAERTSLFLYFSMLATTTLMLTQNESAPRRWKVSVCTVWGIIIAYNMARMIF